MFRLSSQRVSPNFSPLFCSCLPRQANWKRSEASPSNCASSCSSRVPSFSTSIPFRKKSKGRSPGRRSFASSPSLSGYFTFTRRIGLIISSTRRTTPWSGAEKSNRSKNFISVRADVFSLRRKPRRVGRSPLCVGGLCEWPNATWKTKGDSTKAAEAKCQQTKTADPALKYYNLVLVVACLTPASRQRCLSSIGQCKSLLFISVGSPEVETRVKCDRACLPAVHNVS